MKARLIVGLLIFAFGVTSFGVAVDRVFAAAPGYQDFTVTLTDAQAAAVAARAGTATAVALQAQVVAFANDSVFTANQMKFAACGFRGTDPSGLSAAQIDAMLKALVNATPSPTAAALDAAGLPPK